MSSQQTAVTKKLIKALKKWAIANQGEFVPMTQIVLDEGYTKAQANSSLSRKTAMALEAEGYEVYRVNRKGFKITGVNKNKAYEMKKDEPQVSIKIKDSEPEFITEKKSVYAILAKAMEDMGVKDIEDTNILIFTKDDIRFISASVNPMEAEEINFSCRYTKEEGVTVDMKMVNNYKF